MHAIGRCLIAGAGLILTVQRAPAQSPPAAVPSSEADTSARRSKLLPLAENAAFLVGLSAYDRVAYANQVQDGKKVYSSTLSTTWEHLRRQTWVHDQDPFNVNQFAHPYQGATMYAIARTTGHRFWSSLVQANIGSFIW